MWQGYNSKFIIITFLLFHFCILPITHVEKFTTKWTLVKKKIFVFWIGTCPSLVLICPVVSIFIQTTDTWPIKDSRAKKYDISFFLLHTFSRQFRISYPFVSLSHLILLFTVLHSSPTIIKTIKWYFKNLIKDRWRIIKNMNKSY